MATLHFHETTTSAPEQFVAALTDFGPGRSKIFGNSADDYLKVHDRGPNEADVTEGSGGVWERLHYDWSDPDRVVMTTTDSNLCEGKNLKGRVLGLVIGTVGKGRLENAFRKSVKAIEARNDGTGTPELS